MRSTSPESLWTVRDVAAFLNVAPKTIRNWVSAGRVPGVLKIGGALRFEPDAIRNWALRHRDDRRRT